MALAGGLAAWAPAAAAAAGGAWQSVGPQGGAALGLAIDPSAPGTLYAAAGAGGLYKTVDGGRSWIHSDAGLLPNYVLQVAVDPVVPANVFAATGAGVWRSADGGATWRPPGSGLGKAFAACVAIDPRAHRTLYAGAGNQVWKSVDGAASWVDGGSGLTPQAQVIALAIDPRQPATLYAGTATGVFKSVNGGASWHAARTGMGALAVVTVTVDPATAGTVWAGGQSPGGPQAQGLYVSRNNGGTWTLISLPAADSGVFCVVVAPAGQPIYACAEGLWKSANGGRTWQAIDAGLPAGLSIGSLVLDPSSPEVLYAGVDSFPNGGPAVYKSASGGSVWRPFDDGIDAVVVTGLAVDPVQAGTLYALIVNGSDNALLKSADDGAVWAPANAGLLGDTVTALAIDPRMPATLYAETNRAFFSSDDGGARWSRPGGRFQGSAPLVVDPQTPTTLYSAFFAGFDDLYRSLDGGATWAPLGIQAKSYLALAVAPSAPATLYVATDTSIFGLSAGLFASHDGGATFARLGGNFRSIAVLAVDPQEPGTLYVCGSTYPTTPLSSLDFGVWKSSDGGQTFAQLPEVGSLASLLIDPSDPAVIYGGSSDFLEGGGSPGSGDVLISRDGGATWSELAPGLPGATVTQLALGPAGTLYAGTEGAGIYRLALGAP